MDEIIRKDGYTLLHLLALSENDNSGDVQRLIDEGIGVDSITKYDRTPLHCAVSCRKLNTINNLLEAKASVNYRDIFGRTALHYAINSQLKIEFDERTLKLLLSRPDIDLNLVDFLGKTPLMWAVLEKNLIAVKALLKRGANPNIPHISNRTPLHEALYSRDPHFVIIYTLLKYGADIYTADNGGQTPVDILFEEVIDKMPSSIAENCVRIIPLRYHIRESLKHKLERFPQFSDCFEKCCLEVKRMQKQIIYDNFNLHDFVLDSFQIPGGDSTIDIHILVVETLLCAFYTKYFCMILFRMTKLDLFNVLKRITRGRIPDHLCYSEASFTDVFDAIVNFYDEM